MYFEDNISSIGYVIENFPKTTTTCHSFYFAQKFNME